MLIAAHNDFIEQKKFKRMKKKIGMRMFNWTESMLGHFHFTGYHC